MRERATAPRGLEQVTEQLPAGKEPGGFARAFAQVFRAEIEAWNEKRKTQCPASSRSDSPA